MRCAISFLALLLSGLSIVHAAPGAGAIEDGRASCGDEYNTANSAFSIPTIMKGEYWKVSRVATCKSPVFWTKFKTDKDKRLVYIGAMMPKIRRFRDKMQFHAIIYGPGLNGDDAEKTGFRPIPNKLPEDIVFDQALANRTGGAAFISRGKGFDTCDEVTDGDKSLETYYQIVNNRCSEVVNYPEDYIDTVEQNAAEVESWPLYAFSHETPLTGTYYIQSWLTLRSDSKTTAQGKYELRLGPRPWGDPADESVIDLTRKQKTSCTCALNGLDFKQQHLERLGGLPTQYDEAQLQYGKCGAEPANSTCVSSIPQNPLAEVSAVKWAAVYNLVKDRSYTWTFYPTYQGAKKNMLGFPNEGMYFYLRSWYDTDSIASRVAQIVTKDVSNQGQNPKIVAKDALNFWFSQRKVQYVNFTNPTGEAAVPVTLSFTNGADDPLTIFTQYDPNNYYAAALRDAVTGEYIFPTDQKTYKGNTNIQPVNEANIQPKNAPNLRH